MTQVHDPLPDEVRAWQADLLRRVQAPAPPERCAERGRLNAGICKFVTNFGGLVLGCIEADFFE